MDESSKRQMMSGLTLIGLGLALYWLIRIQDHMGYNAVLFVIGGCFMAAYFYFRAMGYLIPGCILLGLAGGGMWGASGLSFGEPIQIGLGLGFFAIYFIALFYERRGHWWPLIPGGALVLTGLPLTRDMMSWFFHNWPLILVVAGVVLLITAFARQSRAR